MDNKKIIELVKKIRSETGLGIMEIKAALDYYNCDYDKGLVLAYLGSVPVTMPACEILKNGGMP